MLKAALPKSCLGIVENRMPLDAATNSICNKVVEILMKTTMEKSVLAMIKINKTKYYTYLNIFLAPNLTENVGILFLISPAISGTSFIKAITTPNTAKKVVMKIDSGYCAIN